MKGLLYLVIGTPNSDGISIINKHTEQDKEAKKVLLGVNVDYSYSQDFPVLKIKLPKNTLTKNGVGVKIDDFASIQVPFSGCDEKSCQSIVKIDNELLKQMHNGQTMLIAFQKSENQQVTLPISLTGFEEAYAQLNQSIQK